MTKFEEAKHWKYVVFEKDEMENGTGHSFEVDALFYFGTVMPNSKAILIRREVGDVTQYYCSTSWQYPGLPNGKSWEPAKLTTRVGIKVIYPDNYDLDEWLP